MIQSEAQLESGLVNRPLHSLGWVLVALTDGAGLRANLKAQLEAHNGISLSDAEFARVLNHLDKGNVFDKAKILRDRMALPRDDGTTVYIQFLNTEEWCRNRYQVTSQVTQAGSYKNRYDVTLLINGLPLIQVELKRRGMELKEASTRSTATSAIPIGRTTGCFNMCSCSSSRTREHEVLRQQPRSGFQPDLLLADAENKLIPQLDAFATPSLRSAMRRR